VAVAAAAEEMEEAPPRWPNVNAPPGYRFKPTPRELIQCYLEPWVATEPGHQSPGEFYGIMAAADVYGEEPGALASRFQHIAHDDGNWYFLSVARWKDGNASSKRMNRAVGALGTWHGSGKRIPVRGAGYRQSFEFRPAGGGKATWLMEEFGTVRNDATGEDGVRVLCRLHLRPKAAAEAADGDERQQQVEANDVPAPCNKRQRQRAAARQVEYHFDADYWTAAPDVGLSSSYATATAPAPPDVGCSSYATTSSHAAAVPVTELTTEALATWQHKPMMEQAGDGGYQYHCAGVHGGVYIRVDDEPQRLEMVTEDVEFTAQDLKLEDSDFVFTVEHLLQLDDGWIMDSNSNAFSVLHPMCDDGVQENNDPKPEPSDGVQENDDDDPKGDTDAS
jgi:hypothetical protein